MGKLKFDNIRLDKVIYSVNPDGSVHSCAVGGDPKYSVDIEYKDGSHPSKVPNVAKYYCTENMLYLEKVDGRASYYRLDNIERIDVNVQNELYFGESGRLL